MRAEAVLVALLLALVAPASSDAAEDSKQLEPTIVVKAAADVPAQSATTLVAGRTYTIDATSYYTEKIPTTDGGTFTYFYDAIYCFAGSTATSVCSEATPRLFESGGLKARIGASGAFVPFHRLGGSSTVPAFKAGHNYAHSFTAPASGRLQLLIQHDPRDSYDGSLGVTLWGPPSPGSTGPSGGSEPPSLNDLLNGDCQGLGGSPIYGMPGLRARTAEIPPGNPFCPKRLRRAAGWNTPLQIADLSPGAVATFLGPVLSATQREVRITLNTSTGDVAATLTEDDAKFRRQARRACVYLAVSRTQAELVQSKLANPLDSTLGAGAFTNLAGVSSYLLPCLKVIDDALARPRALRSSARAAASACRAIAFPIKATRGKSLDSVRLLTRRSDALPSTLRVTCTPTSRGAVVRVRPRRTGTALRAIVGSRLSVGLVRAPSAKGTARGTITFGR